MIAASSSRAVFVVMSADEVVGFASITTSEQDTGTGELSTLYTHPAVWGRGAGRVLMHAALEQLAVRGCREAVLWTEERNERPRQIYERAGWRLDGGRRDRTFLGSPIREVRYRIALAEPTRGPDDEGRPRVSAG